MNSRCNELFSISPRGSLYRESIVHIAQKRKFSITDLVTFTEEIRIGKLHFLCIGSYVVIVVSIKEVSCPVTTIS